MEFPACIFVEEEIKMYKTSPEHMKLLMEFDGSAFWITM